MTKAKQYDTVVLAGAIDRFPRGTRGAVVEVYITPYEAYDIEIVTDEGNTKGLIEAVRPEQFEVLAAGTMGIRFASIRIEDDGARAAVSFSDGTQVTVSSKQLHSQTV